MRDSLGSVVPTADGSLTLSHPEHGECYHSQTGALAEAQALYVDAGGIASRWAQGSAPSVLDVGLGLGYNAVATLASWQSAVAPPDLYLTSLEVNPDLVRALASGAAPWQENWPAAHRDVCTRLRATAGGWSASIPHPHGPATARWTVYVGDASVDELPPSPVAPGYTHVWQDPFSPQKNPPLWSEAWFATVATRAAPGCALMTYSVARGVRDALAAGGWAWEKIPTTMSRKKHWLKAVPALSTT